jgi:L,D-peptidoglycan transpeptidase YkuD (ErfK/YbiS/YcfS/YnhG family)
VQFLIPIVAAAASCGPGVQTTATQLVTVEAASARSSTASVRIWRRSGNCWDQVGGPWPAHLGRNGLSAARREGDGTTPAGVFALGRTVYGTAPNPGTRLRYHRLVCGDWWDGDPTSPTYNTFVHLRCGVQAPFGGDTEPLWTETVAYRHFAVIGFNTGPIVRGRGSGIFLHRSTGKATNGCVSLALPQLVRLLRWLSPEARPAIAIGLAGTARRMLATRATTISRATAQTFARRTAARYTQRRFGIGYPLSQWVARCSRSAAAWSCRVHTRGSQCSGTLRVVLANGKPAARRIRIGCGE